MSLTIDTYEKGDIYIECRWDKYVPHYQVFVGEKIDGIVYTRWEGHYDTKESAKRSFRRQVRTVEGR